MRTVVLNARERGVWGAEQTIPAGSFPYSKSQRFELQVNIEATRVHIRFGGARGGAPRVVDQTFGYRSQGPGEAHALLLGGDSTFEAVTLAGLPTRRPPPMPPQWARGLERAACGARPPAAPQSLAVVFAAILEDVDHHFSRLFASVAAQTAAPEELVTVVSGTGGVACAALIADRS